MRLPWEELKNQLGQLMAEFRGQEITPEAMFDCERKMAALSREAMRVILEALVNALQPETPEALPRRLQWEGESYRRRDPSVNPHLGTLFGAISVRRFRYEALEAGEKSIFPLDLCLGLVAGRATPALAEKACRHLGERPQQAVRDELRRAHNVSWSSRALRAVAQAVSHGVAAQRHDCQVAQVVRWLKDAHKSPGSKRVGLSVGRDGVFVPLRHSSEYREAATATLSVLDRRGQRRGTVYLGHMPEPGQTTLSQELSALIVDVLRKRPGALPQLQYVTDGGHHPTVYRKELRRLEDPLTPGKRLEWQWVVDFFHAAGYVAKLAEALFGRDEAASRGWYRRMRRWLRRRDDGIDQVLRSAGALLAQRSLTAAREQAYQSAYDYLHKRRKFMRYAAYKKKGMMIGSGVTEAACKTVFTQRFKQSGMKWSLEGGQVIVDLRVLLLSGVWDDAFRRHLQNTPSMQHPSAHGAEPENVRISA